MSPAPGPSVPGPRILVIEDEAPMRMALEDILKADGYRVLTAADGQTGLEAANSERPDLVLLDVMLPKIDGLTICTELRSRYAELPVLMLTARGQVSDRVAGLDSGFLAAARRHPHRLRHADRPTRNRAAPPNGARVRDAAPAGRIPRQARHPRALPGRRLGIHGIPDDTDRGHAHGHAAGEDRARARQPLLDQDGAWGGIPTGVGPAARNSRPPPRPGESRARTWSAQRPTCEVCRAEAGATNRATTGVSWPGYGLRPRPRNSPGSLTES